MQAAITAAERGHDVMLFEKCGQLGGQLVFSEYVSFKKPLRDFKNYLIHRVGKLGVQVFLNTEASPEIVSQAQAGRPDAAVGRGPVHPSHSRRESPVRHGCGPCLHAPRTNGQTGHCHRRGRYRLRNRFTSRGTRT